MASAFRPLPVGPSRPSIRPPGSRLRRSRMVAPLTSRARSRPRARRSRAAGPTCRQSAGFACSTGWPAWSASGVRSSPGWKAL